MADEESPFARDFGYLMPFLDKVEQAAAKLPDSAARAEAMRLAAEEKQRWERLKALLAGGAAAPGQAAHSEASPEERRPERAAGPAPEAESLPPARWTIGSLRDGGQERSGG